VNFSTNGLIFQLSEEDRNRLQQVCQLVTLFKGQRLNGTAVENRPRIYFLVDACVTLWVQNAMHPSLAVGLIGPEGAVGLGSALGQNAHHLHFEVQKAGQAWCADAQELQQLLQSHPSILRAIARYLWQMAHDIASMAASIQRDDIPTRLAAWLVLCAKRANSHNVSITHDQLARMMGVRRVSITLAAVLLKEKGFLIYKRGSIEILDMVSLVQLANTSPRLSC
jgi:CRP-like cAMP-binding protein